MNTDFLRYSCQLALPGFNDDTQMLLQNAKVLVVGAGGLGCPAAMYLAAAGIGILGIADDDAVSEGNLHRQILYTPADVGQKKAVLACERLQKQNPGIRLVSHEVRITSQNIMNVVVDYDILVDCTDNFDTRYLLNDAAVLTYKPVVYGAIYQYEGQVAVWNVMNHVTGKRSPNYRDLFPKVDASVIPDCAEGGVIPTLAGIIGCMQANEVIKYFTQTGDLLAGKMLLFDAQTMQSRVIKLSNTTAANITKLTETETAAPTISAQELKLEMEGYALDLIDIRTNKERGEFNIGGQHIEPNELLPYFSRTNPNKKSVLYCASGKRSNEAVKKIKKQYPDANVFSLEGGLKDFSDPRLENSD